MSFFLPIKLFLRGKKEPLYRKFIKERYGVVKKVESDRIWIHCISVGEAIAAKELCRALLKKDKLIITCTTASGREQLNDMYKNEINNKSVLVSYIPLDISFLINKTLNKWKPSQVIFIETDIWPNTVRLCHLKNIPVKLLNARMSNKSFRGYKRLGNFTQKTLNFYNVVSVQYDLDKNNFIRLGLEESKIVLTGSIKADIRFDDKILKEYQDLKINLDRPIWLAASTHEPEEELILDIHKKLLEIDSDILLIIAPRHPNRFNEVELMIKAHELKYSKRSDNHNISNDESVFLADSIGELMQWMVLSNLIYMGKSLSVEGGHNPLEPAFLSKAILSGKNVSNFENIFNQLVSSNAAFLVEDADELLLKAKLLFADEQLCKSMGQNANKVYTDLSGALKKNLALIH